VLSRMYRLQFLAPRSHCRSIPIQWRNFRLFLSTTTRLVVVSAFGGVDLLVARRMVRDGQRFGSAADSAAPTPDGGSGGFLRLSRRSRGRPRTQRDYVLRIGHSRLIAVGYIPDNLHRADFLQQLQWIESTSNLTQLALDGLGHVSACRSADMASQVVVSLGDLRPLPMFFSQLEEG